MSAIGEFELLVLLSILRNRDRPYANRVREELETLGERTVTRGALYRSLDRLREKNLISWELEPSAVPERGGHPMRKLSVTPRGQAAVRSSGLVLLRFLDGIVSAPSRR
jgi:DNA-binding PadR family transcriptional regulator